VHNWNELLTYFSSIENSCDNKILFKVREIKQMIQDPSMFWYAHFCLPIIDEFEKVNSFFQNVDADPEFAFNQLEIQYCIKEPTVTLVYSYSWTKYTLD